MDLLERLTQTSAVAGREHRLRQLILKETKGLFDETRVDNMGSLICVRKARPGKRTARSKKQSKPLRVMLAAHMDQIGFLVRHIDDSGFLRVQNVGGFDCRNLFARLVTVCTEKDDLPGVLNPAGKPVHIATEEDRKKVPEIADLSIDLGLPAKEVQKRVKIGDMVTIKAPFTRVGDTVVAQAMDNRVACWVAIRAIQKLAAKKNSTHNCEIYCVFTVQEEVGCRGAGTASFGVEPDVAISLDTTLCVDTPGVPDDMRVTKQAQGAGLMVMDSSMISDVGLLEEFERLAKKHRIKHQRSVLGRGGNDGATMQRAGDGRKTFALVCPTRYIHTVTEMVHLDDLHACRDLLAVYLGQAG